MRNLALLFVSFVVVIIAYLVSSSASSMMMSIVTLLFGWLMTLLFGKTGNERTNMSTVMLVSFIVITIAAIFQYLDIVTEYSNFAYEGNDNYYFYNSSMEGVGALSISKIFNECVIRNIHYENGGYFFYIKLLAYLAEHYADGNSIMLQQLGTVFPSVLCSVVLYGILSKYCPENKAIKYTCSFMLLSPLILHSVGIHRDAMISLFYFILVYSWLCRDFSIKVGVLQVSFAIMLYYFREQHGLFALSFVVVSLIGSRKRSRFFSIIAVMALIAIVGASYLADMVSSNLAETNEFYEGLRSERLSGLSSGIGRFIYMLPFPLRELAQILFLQLRFPPWLALSEASNFFAVPLGILSFAIAFYWFYVFSFTLVSLLKKGYKCLPSKLIFGLLLLFVFLFLSSANLDSRRVVCMYPLMFVPFVYYKEYVLPMSNVKAFGRRYAMIYAFICLLYLGAKMTIG